MTDEELIARLRVDEPMCEEHFTANAAANRIHSLGLLHDMAEAKTEALVKERDKYRDAFNTNCLVLRGTEERVERLEAALRGLMMHEPDNPDTLWQEARAVLKGDEHD